MDAISDVSRGSQIYSSVPARLPLPDPFDLDEVLGFNEAQRKRNEYGVFVEVKNFDNNKVFINEVDSFCGKYLVQVLSRNESVNENLELVKDGPVDEGMEIKNVDKKIESVNVETDAIKEVTKAISRSERPSPKSPKNIKAKSKEKMSSVKPVDEVTCERVKSMHCILDVEHDRYDTTKLTVADYYDWLELEPGAERDTFLKEKLGKYIKEQKEHNLPVHSDSMKDKNAIPNKQYIQHFNIIGTLKNNVKSEGHVPEGVSEIIHLSDNDKGFSEQLSKCGYVIYHINDSYQQAVEALSVLNSLLNYYNANPDLSEGERPLFILVSTFMTWALTKSLDQNYLELPFIEKDYRKRIPHPNYQLHYELEQQLLKAKTNNKIDSIILTCGITYGHEESVLYYLFETAFNFEDLPVYCSGNNVIPMIHVENLALVVKEIIQRQNEINMPFLFVNDKLSYSLKDLVKAISKCLGSGCYKIMPAVFAFLNDYISQDIYDQITVNINLQSCYSLLDEGDINWKFKEGFVSNIRFLIDEFIQANNKINPRCFVFYKSHDLNMPSLPLLLSKYYNIPYLSVENIVNEYVANVCKLKEIKDTYMNSPLKIGENVFDGDSEGKRECVDILNLDKFVDTVKKLNPKEIKNMLSDTQKMNILQEELKGNLCFYHGYVLDEFPITLHQAGVLFSSEDRKNELDYIPSSWVRFPNYIVYLNETLYPVEENVHNQEIQTQKEHIESDTKIIEKTCNNVEISPEVKADQPFIVKELPVMKYFQESGNRCKLIIINTTKTDKVEQVFKILIKEIEDIEDGKQQSYSFQQSEKEVFEHSNVSEKDISMENVLDIEMENKLLKLLKEQEELILSIKSYPFLNYLIQFVYPTLTNALLEVTNQRPDDPLDFLSEYLFQVNPHGRMIDAKQLTSKETDTDLGFPKIDSKTCLA